MYVFFRECVLVYVCASVFVLTNVYMCKYGRAFVCSCVCVYTSTDAIAFKNTVASLIPNTNPK